MGTTQEISVLGVVGSDGVTPVFEPNARWCIWGMHEIWNGTVGSKRYVPKVNDYIIDIDTYTTYKVLSIDAVTLIPKYVEVKPANLSSVMTNSDQLFGVGPGTQSDTYRCYLDTSVLPYVLAVDARLKIGGSMSNYAKIFLGTDTSSQGKVISRIYDASGHVVTDKVPLELVAIDSHVNYSIKNVSVCYTNVELPDGELVTVVIYGDEGHVISKRQLIVENTGYIRQANDRTKYVENISLDSPFISASQDHVIEFPLNVPISALGLMGRVTYSDGSYMDLPVDGRKFKIFGLDQYVSTIVGQKLDLVLSYTLSEDESAVGTVIGNNKVMTESYSLITSDPNNSYTVKLFGYPVWVSQEIGYIMRWWMMNLDRNVFFDVTNYVRFAENTGAFNPKGYGILQRKAIQLNLRDVSGAFKPFIHTQLVDITLNGMPNGRATTWLMSNTSSDANLPYGENVFAVLDSGAATLGNLNISCGETNIQNWLEKIYLRSYPLVDTYKESSPPLPTHFEILYNNQKVQYTVDQWDNNLPTGLVIPLNSTIFVRFYKWTSSGEMNLSVVAMRVTN